MHRTVRALALALFVAAAPARAQHHHEATTTPAPVSRLTYTPSEIVVEYGPIAPMAHATHDGPQIPPAVFALPADGWLHGFAVEIEDAGGRRQPSRMLHHMNLIHVGRRELFSNEMQRIAGAGSETPSISLPGVLGFAVQRFDSLAMVVMVHQVPGSTTEPVTVRLRLAFKPATSRIRSLTINPVSIAIGIRGQPNLFDLPPGRSEHHWEGSPVVAGRILGLSGHLHRFGVYLKFEDKTTGKLLWETKPQVDGTGDIVSLPVKHFLWSAGLSIRPDHLYRLTAVYENPTDRVVPAGGMGIVAGIMMTSGGARWPLVDRKHPDYLADVKELLGGTP